MKQIIYRLYVEDIQNVAKERLGRELNTEELERVDNKINDCIPWFDSVWYMLEEFED